MLKRRQSLTKTKFLLTALIVIGTLTACASQLPPAKAATSISEIVGVWKGTYILDSGRSWDSKLTIKEDGSFIAELPGITGSPFPGVIKIENGQYKGYSDTGRVFTDTLHEGDGKRILITKADTGRNSGRYTQVK